MGIAAMLVYLLEAALKGEKEFDAFTLKPRVGIDLAYAETSDAPIDGFGQIEIDPTTYGRHFLELGFARETGSKTSGAYSQFAIAPRVFCETSGDTLKNGCGFSGSIDCEAHNDTAGVSWSFGMDCEVTDDQDRSSVSLSRSRELAGGSGTIATRLGLAESGSLQAEHDFEVVW